MKLAKPPHFFMELLQHQVRAFLPMCRCEKPAAAMNGLDLRLLADRALLRLARRELRG